MMDATYLWTIILLLALGTISIRISIISISGRVQISDRAKELFSYIPAAILPAFIVPAAFFHQGQVGLLQGKERLVVLFLAIIVSLKTKSTIATIIFGLVTLYAVVQLGGGM